MLLIKLGPNVKAQTSQEYERYVHTYSDRTFMEKPMFPVLINESQVLIGQNWSIVCPLRANHSYHVYFYGEWVNNGSEPKTDYDIYVYDPYNTLESNHTASAGLPEHLGSTVDESFFVPKFSGNYTFIVVNDAGESMGAQKATFMLIEDLECNAWHTHYVEGRSGSMPVLYTSWAYEFVTESQHVEVLVRVPDTLDMYEVRLYQMADPPSKNYTVLNDVPLAWELGLYGNRSGVNGALGGYNLDSEGYRGVAYASCEHFGQDMFLNFTSPNSGKSLYHLVLIGERGYGTIEFLVKTAFDACLVPSIVPGKVYLAANATIAYDSKSTDLLNATLRYSTDGWRNVNAMRMDILNDSRTCRAVILGQPGGTFVSYRVEAHDVLENFLVASGNYSVMHGFTSFVEKPMLPVLFNESQIEIGQDWSILCPLRANHSYHVYFYGEWVNSGSEPKTDYDIYVYNPQGTLEGYHTASAGLPEHLGSTVDESFFVPKFSGNYTFIIVNDASESMGAQKATFMIVEDVECNIWHTHYVEGKSGSVPMFNTSWAYEFVTESQRIEVRVRVPSSLDMYEVRLYLMADPTSKNYIVLNDVPLAWEPGLYGARDGSFGGYNLKSDGYRGVAYASCEYFGQDMFLNFSAPHSGKSLYHLVFIGEKGNGTVEFLVKTAFDACLVPSIVPGKVYLLADAVVAYVSRSTDLLSATLRYSTDGWGNVTAITMDIFGNRTCRAVIPGQTGGTFVSYRVEARDLLENVLAASGNYSVRHAFTSFVEKPMLPVLFSESQIDVGEDWSVVCPLRANHSYHIYFYGAWVNNGSEPKTDYDIYVYNPQNTLEGSHTESAGLLEHLGINVDVPFFVPRSTGNYTFIIVNDPRESQSAQQATFMIVEDVACNIWHEHYVEGEDSNGLPVFNTSWAYEFVTESQRVEVLIKVPDSLDMYEARLYLMANPTSRNYTLLDGAPLAWEPGLYSNRSGVNGLIGGYNAESERYRGVAYASCEYYGQNMFFNFTSPNSGKSLYHLVFIGEEGRGTIKFLVKTMFDACLQPSIIPSKVYPNNNATVAYVSKSTDLLHATLQYSTDGWKSITTVAMSISDNRTCRAIIPGQAGGSFVGYRVEARDLLENVLVASGNYSVRLPAVSFVEKPMFPVFFNESQIDVGEDWSVVCPLKANHSYHAYFYGEWINNGSEPKTDYDIYIYNPQGALEKSCTASAGLLEHLGTNLTAPYFVPKVSGNYTFMIANDPHESKGAQQATFMIVEDVECNLWHEHYVEGEDSNGLPVFNTSWAYEFATESQHVEVWIKVPDSLDMYEARLYLVADPASKNYTVLDSVPLAWEPGLYGNRSSLNGTLGGYNLQSGAYRGVAYASCEYSGQSMFLNFTAPRSGNSLYHLVLIGEKGNGTVKFLVKTVFDASLVPSIVPSKMYPTNNATVAYVSKSTDLLNATLRYSTDGWKNVTVLAMEILGNRTCRATIPRQNAGTSVAYGIEATDVLEDVLIANGSYSVKRASMLNMTLTRESVSIGENITVKGYLIPTAAGIPISVYFDFGNESKSVECYTAEDGAFTGSFRPEATGTWAVQAVFYEDASTYGTMSSQLIIQVEEPPFLAKYSLYIGLGAGGAVVSVAIVMIYLKKWRTVGSAEEEW